MDLRSASLVFLVVVMVLSYSMAAPLDADNDEEMEEIFNSIYHRKCVVKNRCETVSGHKTCKDLTCCRAVIFRHERPEVCRPST
ncbi:strongylocin 1 precursor [Strongylocentrotus purpuratus]|uniref:Strongylocin 1 n=1 Tax=Strongylocentrotus purpuratus TaxID=7668 RepID=D2JVC3_STRPU|nr:strongylocin 1 precursor [Strongylocentrotus purpuratus]ACZ67125.1 strongylocin 1 [Strongylocentrotus purpuratus]|eukprot:NP_001164288.1 strongylocin 1 precursor [Strongylocentrotus purpuratus]